MRQFSNITSQNIITVVIFIMVGLVAIQIVFEFLSKDIARQRVAIVQSYLNDNRTISNPYLVSQKIEDLELQGSMRCSIFKLYGQDGDFINLSYKTSCNVSYSPIKEILFFQSKQINSKLIGNDGRTWELSFQSIHSSYFRIGLWLTRLIFLLFVFLVFYFLKKTLALQSKAFKIERELKDKIITLTAQVAHDIRSPLAALDSITKDIAKLPEEKRIIIRSAMGRIRDIANNLIEKNRQLPKGASTSIEPADNYLLSSLIDPIITEKHFQFRSKTDIEIIAQLDRASYGLFAKIQPIEFRRLMSNLINNAVEAMTTGARGERIEARDKKTVEVFVRGKEDKVIIEIKDNGKGIAPEILKKLGQKGETHGKEGGSGA